MESGGTPVFRFVVELRKEEVRLFFLFQFQDFPNLEPGIVCELFRFFSAGASVHRPDIEHPEGLQCVDGFSDGVIPEETSAQLPESET